MDRYANNPFLRLLDCYVLDAIDMLDANQRSTLEKMQPRLSKTFGMSGTWREIVEAQMKFSNTVPSRIREFWQGYIVHAQQQSIDVTPQTFAVEFVDQNFPEIVSEGLRAGD